MLDKIFLIAAAVGGAVMVCQFALSLLGLGGEGSDVSHHGGFGGHHIGGGHHGGFGGHHAAGMEASHDGGFDGDAATGDHHAHPAGQDGDSDHSDSSWLFGVLSFRTLTAAAAFFGVTGMTATSAGMAPAPALGIAIAAGAAAMYGIFWLMRAVSQLSSSGNERISSAIGRPATVYIPIPPDRTGAGKVQLSMQNRIVEFQAITDEPERLATGERVQVVEVTGSDVVRVRRVAATVEV